MPKYNETNVVGESWIRSNKVICSNEYGQNPTIYYQEEELFNFSDGKVVSSPHNHMYPAAVNFYKENANTIFEIINPETDLPTGNTATYQDLYILVHSLYFHLVELRDRGPKPFPSWTWDNTSNEWKAPFPKPEGNYFWDETLQQWIEFTE